MYTLSFEFEEMDHYKHVLDLKWKTTITHIPPYMMSGSYLSMKYWLGM